MRAEFEYVHQVIRVPVRARKKRAEKYGQGAYITVPTKWIGSFVNIHLEDKPTEKLQSVQVKGSINAIAYVSVPVDWSDKDAIVELIEENKKKRN